jgi:hypothetical protein
MNKLSHLITNHYQLEEDVEVTLCYRYTTHVGEERTRTYREVLGHESICIKHKLRRDGTELTIDNIDLSCFLCQGNISEREVNCNSAFMLENLPLIATEICQTLQWGSPEESMFLVMDNAGGHGTWNTRSNRRIHTEAVRSI